MRRILLVLSVAVVMAALMVAMVTPAFAKQTELYLCDPYDHWAYEGVIGLSKKQAKEFEKTGNFECYSYQ